MLNPFIDDNQLLRVGGRLQNSQSDYNSKHPFILPPKHPVSEKIITFYHTKYLHAGVSTLMALLRQKFWIIHSKSLIKLIIRKCTSCIRFNGNTLKQIMGNFPISRVNPSPPFYKTAVDYAGPYNLLTRRHRGAKTYKAYIALFVCQVTKAIHLE